MDPETARSLWKLTQGNTLYLRHIVEQAVADGQLEKQNGYWQWVGDPVVPRGLVELIESRIGALPAEVGDVLDALAVGEPIELAALQRITDPDAVEEADVRGLIRLDDVDDRDRSPDGAPAVRRGAQETARRRRRLRRLRGLLAVELAGADDRDDVRMVVRRGALTLDSDLEPDADAADPSRAGRDLPGGSAARRSAGEGGRAGRRRTGSPVPACARVVVAGPRTRSRGAAGRGPGRRVDATRSRRGSRICGRATCCGRWLSPMRAKEVIDEGAARVAPGRRGMCIDAVRAVYWFAVDRPDAAMAASKVLVLDELPPIVGAETAWALASIHGDAGRTAEAVAMAEAGYAIAIRCSDAPHMRFNIADAHVGALVLAGRIGEALEVAEWARGQAADLPGTAHLLGPAIAGRAALGAGRLDDGVRVVGAGGGGVVGGGP